MNIFLEYQYALAVASVVIVIIGSSEIGRLFKVSGFPNEALLGLLFLSTLLAPLTYISAPAFLPIAQIALLAAIVFKGLRLFKISKAISKVEARKPFENRINFFAKISASLALSILTVHSLFPHEYVFETHDVLYLGWIDGFWSDQSSGALIVNVAYPQVLGSFHIQPSIAIAVLGAFSPSMNLILAQFIKAILISLFFTYCYFSLITFAKKNFVGVVGFIAIFGFIGGRYLGYSLGMSSYMYVLILLAACINLSWQSRPRYEFWVFLMFLSVAKAPIFFVALIPAVYLYFKIFREIPKTVNIPMLGTVFIGFMTWVIGGKSAASIEGNPSLLGVFPNLTGTNLDGKFAEWVNSFLLLNSWMIDYIGHDLLPRYFALIDLSIANLIWLFISIYVTFAASVWAMQKARKIQFDKTSLAALKIFMAVSIGALLLIRNGPSANLAHQTHAFFLAAIVSAFMAGSALLAFTRKSVQSIAVFLFALFALKFENIPITTSTFEEKSKSSSAIVLSPEISTNDFLFHLISAKREPDAQLQVATSMLGLRLPWSEAKQIQESQLNRFLSID